MFKLIFAVVVAAVCLAQTMVTADPLRLVGRVEPPLVKS